MNDYDGKCPSCGQHLTPLAAATLTGWVTVREAADILGVRRQAVAEQIRRGLYETVRREPQIMLRREEIERRLQVKRERRKRLRSPSNVLTIRQREVLLAMAAGGYRPASSLMDHYSYFVPTVRALSRRGLVTTSPYLQLTESGNEIAAQLREDG